MLGGSLGGLGRDIALIDEGDLDILTGGRLHGFCKAADLGAIVRIGRRDVQSQEMAEGIDGGVDLRALLALGAVVAGPVAALGRGEQRSAVEHRGRGHRITLVRDTKKGLEVMGQPLEAAGPEPASGLVVGRVPGRKVVRQQPPQRARLHKPAQRVEHLAQRVLALPRRLRQERQLGRKQRAILVGDIRGVRFAGHVRKHRARVSVHNRL